MAGIASPVLRGGTMPAAAGAVNTTFAPGGFSGMVARNTGPGADAAIGRSAGAPPGTFTPSAASIYPTLSPRDKAMQLIQGQPGYVAASNDANLAQGEGASARRAAIQQAARQTGLPIDQIPGFKDVYGDLDPNVMHDALANPYSGAKQGEHDAQVLHDQDVQRLGATGGYASGDQQAALGNENYERGLGLYNLANSFTNAANTAIGSYTGILSGNREKLAAATQAAGETAASNPAFASILAGQPGFNQTPPVRNNGLPIGGVPQHPTGAQSQFTPRLRRENF